MDLQTFTASATDDAFSEEIYAAVDAAVDDCEPGYLGWTPVKKHVVRNWWVPILLRKQGIVPLHVPRAQIRRVIAFDEPEVLDEAPLAYEKRALEWGSFNAAALLM